MDGRRQTISEEEAVKIAERVAEENDWIFVEPVLATWHSDWFGGGGKWEIYSNAERLGAKVRVVIESPSGKVLEKGYIPR
ncbi:MAG: hypothetical protein LUM44_24605 [Pyrinomonadaceae bacterium]|nr:hypothetical protein [Pyrinomonadaceae bacterium]